MGPLMHNTNKKYIHYESPYGWIKFYVIYGRPLKNDKKVGGKREELARATSYFHALRINSLSALLINSSYKQKLIDKTYYVEVHYFLRYFPLPEHNRQEDFLYISLFQSIFLGNLEENGIEFENQMSPNFVN